jgi:hypothetical protein
MKVTPIIMSAPMVKALLAGRKQQTRRAMNPQPIDDGLGLLWGNKKGKKMGWAYSARDAGKPHPHWIQQCPYGGPGDYVWVRENVWLPRDASPREMREGADTWQPDYYADGITCFDTEQYKQWGWKPTPSIHMPRRVSRLTLELTDVRVERLQDISEKDANAEGCQSTAVVNAAGDDYTGLYASEHYIALWESLNGPGSWDANPFVWCLSFRVHQVNIDTFIKAKEATAA